MSQFSIFLVDFLRIRNWFRYQSIAKIFVVAAFLLVVSFILVLEYILAEGFFGFLSYQKEFGKLTASYCFNAGFLFLFLLAVVSGVAATNNALYRPEIVRFLVSTPISSGLLFTSRMVQVAIHSLWIVGIFLAPPLLSYGRNFIAGSDYFIRCLVVLIVFTLASLAISALFTILLVGRFGRLSGRTIVFMFGLVIFCFFLLIQIFFPSSFFLLRDIENIQTFQEKLSALPLSSHLLPTNWLSTTIVDSWSFSTLAAFVFGFILVTVAFYCGKKFYITSWQAVQEDVFLAGTQTVRKNTYSHFPSIIPRPLGRYQTVPPLGSLYINELLGVIRSSSEVFYIAFIAGLLVVMLFVGSKVPRLQEISSSFLHIVYAIFLVGLSYIFMTLSLRLVYPLMAKEKRLAWFIFSLPIQRENLLIPKSAFAASLIFMSIPVGVFGGYLIDLPQNLVFIFAIFLSITIGFVTLANLFIGTIAPNFAEGNNPEAASTSGSGLVATMLSLAFIVFSGFLFYSIIVETIVAFFALILLCLTAASIILLLFLMAKRSIKLYNL